MVEFYRTEPLDYKMVLENIVNGTCDYLVKNKIKTCILGCSGGIDSTLTAAICRLVRDRIGVPLIGVSLPCSTNGSDEISTAELVGKEFCDKFEEINIQNLFIGTEKLFSSYDGMKSTNISQGNIKARIRGSFLHNMASITGGIVMDTDNLTEMHLGFWTICGGDEGELNPIGGLWKHEVYELSDYIRKNVFKSSKALELSMSLIPTDGNGVKSGGDLEQIAPGKTYNDVDEILHAWVGIDSRIKEDIIKNDFKSGIFNKLCEKHGFDTVKSVIMRSVNTEFKRSHRPFVIDIYKGIITDKGGKLIP